MTPLAVENSVGKLTAPHCGAPNASTGKRAWRTPIPHLVPARPRGRVGTFCFFRFSSRPSTARQPFAQYRCLKKANARLALTKAGSDFVEHHLNGGFRADPA